MNVYIASWVYLLLNDVRMNHLDLLFDMRGQYKTSGGDLSVFSLGSYVVHSGLGKEWGKLMGPFQVKGIVIFSIGCYPKFIFIYVHWVP